MQIRVLSDLHIEWSNNQFTLKELPTDSETTLILAGDIGGGTDATVLIKEWSKRFKHIIYVAGNHEFYGHTLEITNVDIAKELQGIPNVHYLSLETGTSVELDSVAFFGETFWTSLYDPSNPGAEWFVRRYMNDLRYIKRVCPDTGADIPFTTDYWKERFASAKQSLENVLKSNPDKSVVVVTHHAPSQMSSSMSRFDIRSLDCAYFTDMSELILCNPNIKLWCHGHMHNSSHYYIGDTRVIANPFGYTGYSTNRDFKEDFLISI